MNKTDQIKQYIETSASVIGAVSALSEEIVQAVDMWAKAISSDRKVIFCGNGGSAADSQHLAAELMGRFLFDRDPMAAISLTVDTSALTAIGNDYGFDKVFERQLRGIGKAGDVLVGMSTSGNSANVVAAFEVARTMGIATISMTGANSGRIGTCSDLVLAIHSTKTSHIQEGHIVIGHLICGLTEERLCLTRS